MCMRGCAPVYVSSKLLCCMVYLIMRMEDHKTTTVRSINRQSTPRSSCSEVGVENIGTV